MSTSPTRKLKICSNSDGSASASFGVEVEEGLDGLQERSRRPHISAGQTPIEIEEQIVADDIVLIEHGGDAVALAVIRIDFVVAELVPDAEGVEVAGGGACAERMRRAMERCRTVARSAGCCNRGGPPRPAWLWTASCCGSGRRARGRGSGVLEVLPSYRPARNLLSQCEYALEHGEKGWRGGAWVV